MSAHRLALAFALVLLPLAAHAEEATMPTGFLNKTTGEGDATRKYVVYVPPSYTPAQSWPMVVFLHGAGERGDDGLVQAQTGIGNAIRKNPERFPAIVVMPQCPAGHFWDAAIPAIEWAMEQTLAEYNVDPKRISLTGLSMGGYMTWLWGAQKTDTFAAFLPICGGGDLDDIRKLIGAKATNLDFGPAEARAKALATRPVWVFHGKKDSAVPVARSREMVALVKAAGGNVQYTEYPELDHNSWDATYQDAKVIAWLLSQRLP